MHSPCHLESCFGLYFSLIYYLFPFGNFVWEKSKSSQLSAVSGIQSEHSFRHSFKTIVCKQIAYNVMQQIQWGLNRTDWPCICCPVCRTCAKAGIDIHAILLGLYSYLMDIPAWCLKTELKQVLVTVFSKFPWFWWEHPHMFIEMFFWYKQSRRV